MRHTWPIHTWLCQQTSPMPSNTALTKLSQSSSEEKQVYKLKHSNIKSAYENYGSSVVRIKLALAPYWQRRKPVFSWTSVLYKPSPGVATRGDYHDASLSSSYQLCVLRRLSSLPCTVRGTATMGSQDGEMRWFRQSTYIGRPEQTL